MSRWTILGIASIVWLGGAEARAAEGSLLVFSKTAGFRHDSIPVAIAALDQLAVEHDWTITATEDAAVFTDGTLETIDVVVFMMTTGDVLDEGQQAGLQAFVEAGHGFVGVHSATNTEETWPWFGELLAARFTDHPAQQDATVHVVAPDHPACAGLPEPWPRFDEWYNFDASPSGTVEVLLQLDEGSYEGGTMGRDHPIAWAHVLGDARVFYTGAGHTDASWADPLWLGHVAGGIDWVIEGEPPVGGSESGSSGGGASSEGGDVSSGGEVGSTGGVDAGDGSSGGVADTGLGASSDGGSTSGATTPTDGESGGCGCGAPHGSSWWLVWLAPLVRRRRALPAACALALGACDPARAPEADATPPQIEAPASPRATDASSGDATPAAKREAPAATPVVARTLEVRFEALRRSGDAVEIEVALDRPLPATGRSRPTLVIGDREFRRSRRAQGRLDRLVFLLSAADLDALADGSTMIVRDVGVSSESMAQPPVLDKSRMVVTP